MSIKLRLRDAEGSGERRYVTVAAANEDEAVETVLRQEQKKVAFVLDPSDVAAFEKRLREGTLTGRDKARLFSHRQSKPYTIVKADK